MLEIRLSLQFPFYITFDRNFAKCCISFFISISWKLPFSYLLSKACSISALKLVLIVFLIDFFHMKKKMNLAGISLQLRIQRFFKQNVNTDKMWIPMWGCKGLKKSFRLISRHGGRNSGILRDNVNKFAFHYAHYVSHFNINKDQHQQKH